MQAKSRSASLTNSAGRMSNPNCSPVHNPFFPAVGWGRRSFVALRHRDGSGHERHSVWPLSFRPTFARWAANQRQPLEISSRARRALQGGRPPSNPSV